MDQRRRRIVAGLLPVATVLILWELSAAGGWVRSDNWPAVSQILAALVREILHGNLLAAFGETTLVILLGFVAGALGGAALATAAALSAVARTAFGTVVELLRPIPVPALVPPLVLLFGTELPMKVIVVAASVLFPVFINTLAGFDSLDPQLRLVARTHRLSRWAFVRDILLPTSLPGLFSGLRIGIGIALVVAITAEIIVGGSGVGHYLLMMQFATRPAEMYGAVLVLLVLGYFSNIPLKRLERICVFWKNTTR